MRVEPPAIGSLELESSSSARSTTPARAGAAGEEPAAVVAGSVTALNARAADADAARAEHVARIAAQVRAGAYRVDLRALAERMVSEDGDRLQRLLVGGAEDSPGSQG